MKQADLFRRQAEACADLGSPMYADLLARLADDLEAGGPTADVLARPRGRPRALGARAAAARLVHRLVLERRAGGARAFYPSVGGSWEPEAGWAAFRRLLAEQPAAVREWLDRPPQTNEVGRAAALVGGLLHLEEPARLPVRVFEIGVSGGLNLLADRFAYVEESGTTSTATPAAPYSSTGRGGVAAAALAGPAIRRAAGL